ncbi:E3 ubiquitin-protein ligase MIB2-like isoform X2 [Rhopilema esculentum]|uniref:E3 ubiquitin-protein ligase MIB2-like isoform X2 n=1 Tax=Rhopilema esculentum TaxID=499914 RepID=UPI0031DC879F
MSILKPGIRVVRGPNWSNGSEDGGDWHLGSVVETSNRRVTVHWDNGNKGSYSFNRELTIFDVSPLGIPHVGVTCDVCSKSNFVGIRWTCVVCNDFDLCDSCYHKGNHSLDHDFYRINVNRGERTKVGQRNGTPCRTAFGIFPGAIVKRGPDWNWNDQDGGSDKTGKVLALYDWSNNAVPKSERSGARVAWSSGTAAEYRICFQGKCDLIAKEPAASSMFFSSHLPVLDEACFESTPDEFAVGNRVFVYVNKERAKELQQNHGGWNEAMEEFIGSIGEVSRILPNGDIGVNYKPKGMEMLLRAMALGAKKHVEWVYNPACLKKVESFAVNDSVTVLGDKEVVEKMQNGHGGWIDQMQMSIGKTGVIKEIDSDGDIKVGFGAISWTFSPAALTKKTSNGPNNNPTGNKTSGSFLADLLSGFSMNGSEDLIFLSVIENDVSKAKRLLENKPALVNHSKEGLTALHIACDAGKKEFVELLLSNGADVNKEDKDGDTALHRASLKKRVDIVKILVKKGVAMNKSNGKGMTAFHCAAYLGHVEVMKILVDAKADVNTQDTAGDTPLHDAIGQDKQPSVEFLIELKNIDFTIVNRRGFNPLHHAVFSGKNEIVTKILEKVPELVNVQKEDGFAALHLAVVNGYEGIVLHILNQGYCVIDQKNTKGQTPFMLAATEGYMGMLKTLLDRGAEINMQDEDGDTSLHVVLKKHELFKLLASDVFGEVSLEVPSIVAQFEKPKASSVAIACYLVEIGADISIRNDEGVDVIGAVSDQNIKDLLKKFEERKSDERSGIVPNQEWNQGAESRNRPNLPPDEIWPYLCTSKLIPVSFFYKFFINMIQVDH